MLDCTKDTFRRSTVSARLASLTDRLERDREKLTKKRKRRELLVRANVILTGIGVACSTVGGALSGTGVGIVVSGPVVGVGALCGVGALLTLRLHKANDPELNQELVTLGQAKISHLQKLVSKALSDENISEEQFDTIIDEFVTYESQRTKLTELRTTELQQQVVK